MFVIKNSFLFFLKKVSSHTTTKLGPKIIPQSRWVDSLNSVLSLAIEPDSQLTDREINTSEGRGELNLRVGRN